MGQTSINPFKETLEKYQQVSTIQNDKNDITNIFKELQGTSMISLRRLKISDENQFNENYRQYQNRRQFCLPQLQSIKQIATNHENGLCTDLYEIASIWDIYDHDLQKQITNRSEIGKQFTCQQIQLLICSIIKAMAYLQQRKVYHQKLRSSSIYLKEQGEIVLSDPLSLAETSNFQKIRSRRFDHEDTQYIYLSPQQCSALQNEAVCLRSHKDDVWVLGMIILECGQLGNQSICYRNQNTKVNWTILQSKIDKFEKRFNAQLADIVRCMLTKTKTSRKNWKQLEEMLNKQVKLAQNSQPSVNNPILFKINPYQNIKQQSKTISQVSPPLTARFGTIPNINNQIAQKTQRNLNYVNTPQQNNTQQIFTPGKNPVNNIIRQTPKNIEKNYAIGNIPTSQSIYRQPQTYNFTYNKNPTDQSNNIPYNQKYSAYDHNLHKNISNDNKLQINYQQQVYYHFPSVKDIKESQSAGYYMINSKQNDQNKRNGGNKIQFPYTRNQKNQFASLQSQQGYLFTHLSRKNNNSSASVSSDNINPYLSKDILMSWERQKKDQNSNNSKANNHIEENNKISQYQKDHKNLPTQRSPSNHKTSSKNSEQYINLSRLNNDKNYKKQLIKQAESITYDNQYQYFSKNLKEGQKTDKQRQRSSGIDPQNLEYIIQEFKEGSRYEGQKFGSMRQGRGKFFYQDGGYYDGEWNRNKMNGYGKLYYQSGKLAYEGNWTDDQFSGKGILYNDQPEKVPQNGFDCRDFDTIEQMWDFYEGQFDDDLKKGRGKLMLSNGEYYVGDFDDDMIHGKGKFYSKDRIIHGRWETNHLVQQF